MRLTVVDVFAETPFAGNQLAVVHDAATLTTAQMQAIALEMNYSETTFVTRRTSRSADVRIFTPAAELPFAGHPTLGTAWLLADGEGEITLNLAAGAVPVRFVEDIGWLTPPPVELGTTLPAPDSARLVNLSEGELHPEYPRQVARVGPRFLLLGVRDLAVLKEVKINEALYTSLQQGDETFGVYVFSPQSYSADADYAARMFFMLDGIREDPATGSANAAFAAYLRNLKKGGHDVIVDQGVEIGRPSRLYLRTGDELAVGGKVQKVLEGELQQLPAP